MNYNKPLLLIGIGIGMACANVAMAGFQFTAPVQQAPQESVAIPPLSGGLLPPLPDLSVESQGMPVQQQSVIAQDSVAAPTPLAVPQVQQPVVAAPVQTPRQPQQSAIATGIGSLAPQTAMPATQMPTPVYEQQAVTTPVAPAPVYQHAAVTSAPQSGQYDLAVGFGNDLPLVTALEQVVPKGYTYVMTDSVPMASPVSWEGGRPWNIVLQDMLKPLGMRADISGRNVSIVKDSRRQPVQAQAQTPAPTPLTPMAAAVDVPAHAGPQPFVHEAQPMTPLAEQVAQPMVQPVAMNVMPNASRPVFSAPRQQPVSRNVPEVTRGTWTSERGSTLRSVLEAWSTQAGAELFWSSDYDYPLAGAVNISGTFEEAVETLLAGFEEAKPKPVARLHPNLPHGPAVLVVETRQVLD